MKQKSLMGRGNDTEEKQNAEASEMNPETLGKCLSQWISISCSLVKHELVNATHSICCKGNLAAEILLNIKVAFKYEVACERAMCIVSDRANGILGCSMNVPTGQGWFSGLSPLPW